MPTQSLDARPEVEIKPAQRMRANLELVTLGLGYLKFCFQVEEERLRSRRPSENAIRALRGEPVAPRIFQIQSHRDILRPESLYPLGHIAVIDIAAVDFHEVMEGVRPVPGTLARTGEFVMKRRASFSIECWQR